MREQLVRVSTRLFAERGFENVTVAEIAAAADVSKMTVFNYFPFKEDLVFDAHERMAESLARAVRERVVGRSALRGLREAYLAALAGGGGTVLTGRVSAEFARLVRDSPRLRSREREIGDRGEEALAAELAAATGAPPGDLAACLAAAQLAAAHRVLVGLMRRWVLDGVPTAEADRRAAAAAADAFGALEPVLGGYAVREG
ncbi:TetR/AcrR family transcriptional regulator [Streptomyces sp. NBC_01340]|uniref:TetR/AcrR family transcriptional regulator n=1 Tax=unclassified Streptomyces TaxID=2593676 RepID=UPI002259A147|nr:MULTISPECIES: TetR/AcrR family transcriptional regulator [unclassified Streptomyces]MCX4457444.1 TetR/AcrR family transcriptional regulator [Streptomyces sp. NBC_01719]MCX4496801.1 TetR/AcrR family transcriptional regulator [Streptomyces sp. NBC_01728]WSI41682.1 TetR/AcrR family transcriptional regulator [Streptomyces sp. NBC_01340]